MGLPLPQMPEPQWADIWSSVRERVRLEFGQGIFDTWIAPLSLSELYICLIYTVFFASQGTEDSSFRNCRMWQLVNVKQCELGIEAIRQVNGDFECRVGIP